MRLVIATIRGHLARRRLHHFHFGFLIGLGLGLGLEVGLGLGLGMTSILAF